MIEEPKVTKPVKKTKLVPVTMPESTDPIVLDPMTVGIVPEGITLVGDIKVHEIQGVGCVVHMCGSTTFVPGVRVLGDNLVANKR